MASAMGGEKPVGAGEAGEIRCEIRFAPKHKFGRSVDAPQNQAIGKGATGAAKFTPRGTTYVFVNVVVAPRYVARVQPGSGGLKGSYPGTSFRFRLSATLQ